MKYNNKEVEYLQSILKIRDWSVSTVNGKKDKQKQMPCREDSDYWKPLIELKTGQILNWEKGVTASTNYKVSDSGVYRLLDKNKNVVAEREGYVPRLLAPEDKSFAGDYVMMNIDENGFIKNWKPVLNQFDFNFINETMSFRQFLNENNETVKNNIEKLKSELENSNLLPMFEIEVMDKHKEIEFVTCDIKIENNMLVCQRDAVNTKEEDSKFIAKSEVEIDEDFTLDENLQELYDEVINDIIEGDLFDLVD